MGRGKLIGGNSTSPSDDARMQIFRLRHRHDVAGDRLIHRRRLLALHGKQRADFDPLPRPMRCNRTVLLQRAGKYADVAQPLHERIDPRFENLGRQGSRRIAFQRYRVPILLPRPRHGRRRQRSLHQHRQQFIESDACLASRRKRSASASLARTASPHSRSSSAFDGISPSRYFSITVSSASMIDSTTVS